MKTNVSIKDINSRFELLNPDEKKTALGIFTKIGKIVYEASSHKEVMLEVAGIILRRYPDQQETIFNQ